MRRLLYSMLVVGLLVASGCIDFDQVPERECLEDRRCAPNDAPVCGEDGQEYACKSMARCFGVSIDPSGESCADTRQPPSCPLLDCDTTCRNGYQVDDNGCQTCECIPSSCRITSCEDEPGAQPCPSGTESTNVGSDDDGCPICDCRPIQCELDGSGEDACLSIYCGSSRADCFSPSDDIVCPGAEPPYYEPPPQCTCAGSECLKRECAVDGDCDGADGLCVHIPTPDGQAFCVSATCEDLVTEHDRIAERFNTCSSDSDCRMYSAIHQCCSAYAASRSGLESLERFDEFIAQTSCGSIFADTCTRVDCEPLPTDPEHAVCVDGRCEYAP